MVGVRLLLVGPVGSEKVVPFSSGVPTDIMAVPACNKYHITTALTMTHPPKYKPLLRQASIKTNSSQSSSNKCKNYLLKLYSQGGNLLILFKTYHFN